MLIEARARFLQYQAGDDEANGADADDEIYGVNAYQDIGERFDIQFEDDIDNPDVTAAHPHLRTI